MTLISTDLKALTRILRRADFQQYNQASSLGEADTVSLAGNSVKLHYQQIQIMG